MHIVDETCTIKNPPFFTHLLGHTGICSDPSNHSQAVVANMLVRHCVPLSLEWIWRCCRHFGRAHGVDVTRRLTPPSTWTVQREKWRENVYFLSLHLFFMFEYTGLLCEIPSFCDTYQCFRNIQCCTGLRSKKAKSQYWMTLSLKVQCVILPPTHPLFSDSYIGLLYSP